jgi:hypothetical protein
MIARFLFRIPSLVKLTFWTNYPLIFLHECREATVENLKYLHFLQAWVPAATEMVCVRIANAILDFKIWTLQQLFFGWENDEGSLVGFSLFGIGARGLQDLLTVTNVRLLQYVLGTKTQWKGREIWRVQGPLQLRISTPFWPRYWKVTYLWRKGVCLGAPLQRYCSKGRVCCLYGPHERGHGRG